MPRGLFITLEGLDGSGKTTQIKRLAAWMEKRSLDPVVTRQPGGTATGDRIRALLLDSASTAVAPMTEMALMFADRAQAIAEIIEPALDRRAKSSSATASPTPLRPTRAAAASWAPPSSSTCTDSSAATCSPT